MSSCGFKILTIEVASGPPGSIGPTGATGATGPLPTGGSVTLSLTRFIADGLTSSFGPLAGWNFGDTQEKFLVALNGVLQDPEAFVVGVNQITFPAPLPAGVAFTARRLTVTLS